MQNYDDMTLEEFLRVYAAGPAVPVTSGGWACTGARGTSRACGGQRSLRTVAYVVKIYDRGFSEGKGGPGVVYRRLKRPNLPCMLSMLLQVKEPRSMAATFQALFQITAWSC